MTPPANQSRGVMTRLLKPLYTLGSQEMAGVIINHVVFHESSQHVMTCWEEDLESRPQVTLLWVRTAAPPSTASVSG